MTSTDQQRKALEQVVEYLLNPIFITPRHDFFVDDKRIYFRGLSRIVDQDPNSNNQDIAVFSYQPPGRGDDPWRLMPTRCGEFKKIALMRDASDLNLPNYKIVEGLIFYREDSFVRCVFLTFNGRKKIFPELTQ